MATAAQAQSTDIPQIFSTQDGNGTASTTLTGVPTGTNGDATIELNLFGDLDFDFSGGTPAEVLTVRLDGVSVGTTATGFECGAFMDTITVPAATLEPLIADG